VIPLVDTHCHLCAGLDDGPESLEEAIEMCRIAYQDGSRWIAATAHQNERYPDVTPAQIKSSIATLAEEVRSIELPLALRPTGEVMVQLDTLELHSQGKLLTVGDQNAYLLLEYPTGLFVDIRHIIQELGRVGLRPILAHPERHPELLHDSGRIEELIQMGALIQVSASSVTDARSSDELKALKCWVKRGVVHVIGSDGHATEGRTPLLSAAYRRIADWAGASVADRICSTNGLAVMQGLPLHAPQPQRPKRRRWWWWGK
jgi:protein-tyrosine phosphatase